jgi:hypothetical protein
VATLDRPRSSASLAASEALDAQIMASCTGGRMLPDGTVIVPKELAAPALVAGYKRAGSPVAIVDEDGHALLEKPRQWREPILIGAILFALVVWFLARRRVQI